MTLKSEAQSIRSYKMGTDQTFDEWISLFENELLLGMDELGAQKKIYFERHNEFFKKLTALNDQYKDIINHFHDHYFFELLKKVENQNYILNAAHIRKGKIPLPAHLAQIMLWGLEISKNETGSYELFRSYYSKSLKNNFNLFERYKLNYGMFEINVTEDDFVLEKAYHNYFHTVPCEKPRDTSWARSLKQTLNNIIKEHGKKWSILVNSPMSKITHCP